MEREHEGIQEVAQALLKEQSELHIVVVGKTGIGKSTVINGIIGENVAEVGNPMEVRTEGVTKTLQSFEKIFKKNNGTVILYDTPGLFDDTIKENVLAQIKELVHVDVFFVCIDMTVTRSYAQSESGEVAMIKLLKKELSNHIWKNTVILFLKANMVVSVLSLQYEKKEEIKNAYDHCFGLWSDIITRELKDIHPDNLTFAAAGHPKQKNILETDKDPWLSTIWQVTFEKIESMEGKAALAKLNFDRLTTVTITQADIEEKQLKDQPINVSKLLDKVKVAGAGAAGSAAGGVLGGGVGLSGLAIGGALTASGVTGAGGSVGASSVAGAVVAGGALAALTNPVGLMVVFGIAAVGIIVGGGIAGIGAGVYYHKKKKKKKLD